MSVQCSLCLGPVEHGYAHDCPNLEPTPGDIYQASDLLVIVPSRGRPGAVAELAQAFAATCAAATRLVFAVDGDDPTRDEYVAAVHAAGVKTHTQPSGGTMVSALNHAALAIASMDQDRPFAIGFMGDDHRPRTVGWDERYLEALHSLGTGLVYGNDLIQGEKLPTQCAMTADIVRTLGYMAPPDLTHLYVDDAWLSLGRALGRITYLPDVVVEHVHPVAGKAQWDAGYARVNASSLYARDRVMFERWLQSLPLEVARLKAVAR